MVGLADVRAAMRGVWGEGQPRGDCNTLPARFGDSVLFSEREEGEECDEGKAPKRRDAQFGVDFFYPPTHTENITIYIYIYNSNIGN